MKRRRTIVFSILFTTVVVVATGIVLTVQVSRNMVYEALNTEQWLWAHYQQDRQLLKLRGLVGEIAQGADVDDSTYVIQRELVQNRLRISREQIDTNSDLFMQEAAMVAELEDMFARYEGIEGDPTRPPTPATARDLLPILDDMLSVSVRLINERLDLMQMSYIQSTTSVRGLLVVQIASLVVLCVAGSALVWLTHRTMKSELALTRAQSEILERKAREVERELEIARQIQSKLFPKTLPQPGGATLAAECLPAREMGGDFYDVVVLSNPHKLAVVVGDASGKSIPGALLMAVARSVVRAEANEHHSPAEVLRATNRRINGDVPKYSFVALCYAAIDLSQHSMSLANAGQLAPLRRRADGCIEYLNATGPTLPLGIASDTNYMSTDIALYPGDLLVFYTDGVVEAQNQQRGMFGFEQLEHLLSTHGHLPPQQFIRHVTEEVMSFTGPVPQHDDITLVALRID